MIRLLLDTHVMLWWDMESPKLGAKARQTINEASEVYVSAASEWELAIKAGIGKLDLKRSIAVAVDAAGFRPLPVSFDHARRVGRLDPVHKDPFDRLIIAAAIVEKLHIVTADEVFAKYPVRVIDAAR